MYDPLFSGCISSSRLLLKSLPTSTFNRLFWRTSPAAFPSTWRPAASSKPCWPTCSPRCRKNTRLSSKLLPVRSCGSIAVCLIQPFICVRQHVGERKTRKLYIEKHIKLTELHRTNTVYYNNTNLLTYLLTYLQIMNLAAAECPWLILLVDWSAHVLHTTFLKTFYFTANRFLF